MSALALTILLIGIAVVAILALMLFSWRRTDKLKEQFGPEYDRVVEESGNKRRAEGKLETMRKRVQRLPLPCGTVRRTCGWQ
jgi:hypothetical protein